MTRTPRNFFRGTTLGRFLGPPRSAQPQRVTLVIRTDSRAAQRKLRRVIRMWRRFAAPTFTDQLAEIERERARRRDDFLASLLLGLPSDTASMAIPPIALRRHGDAED